MPRLSLRWMLPALPLVFLAVVLVAPVLRLLDEGLGGAGDVSWWALWQDDHLRWRVLWSFAQAAITCALALLLGLPLAWVLARLEFAGRGAVLRLLMLPFVVPTLVAALGVLSLWGPRGWLGEPLASAGFDLEGSPWLLLYGNLFFNLCLVVRAGVDALEQVSAARVGAARSLGASPWRAFWRVEWPAIAPWLASALCLVFLYCFSGFGLALILGGQRYATVEVEIYTLVAYELELGQAGVLAVWMLGLTGGVALAYARIEKRLAAPGRITPVARRRPQGLGQWAAVAGTLAVLGLVCAAPLLAIVGQAARALLWGQGGAVLLEPATGQALWNTLRFSAMALVLATALGLTHALAVRGLDVAGAARGASAARGGLALAWRAAAFLPFVVSPVTVAFGLLLLYPDWTASLGLLVAAYALLAYPFVAKSLTAALDGLPASYAQAAATLGASPWRVFWRVTLPLVSGALRRGMAFAAATALGEFAVSLFLSRPEWTTLTTLIYQRLGRPGAGNLDAALVLACVLMLLALLAFAGIEGKKDNRSHA
ncbi:MAG: iron ABC transporter permease [Hydrogenophaga sp.]|uniref:ABC transporter permease n=1 Tax=Hydrogenophaga sp. TaxID=1904254 RepID=UPI0027173F35|nr:iron ABC transporter permease [Hydrogenophaga sp.]MDO9148118.1 iron ABC transporter permease [Hydrogenophaga sp.]MDO9603742.1 iron ABC transporter permease [Hydrogenophaga sp.]